MFQTAVLYYFSPTGGTKKAGEIFCAGISEHVKTVDLGLRNKALEKPDSDMVVIAVPVFGGRVPAMVTEKLNELDGNGKKTVTLAVYGNRAYEDALLELNHVAEERGFQVTASAALVAQHSMAPEVGKGRPDDQDRRSILDFAGKVLDKMEKGTDSPVKVPGDYPYKERSNMPAAPVSLSACSLCGTCVSVCPAGAVRLENDAVATSPETCMLCMACVSVCPEHARILPPPLQEKTKQMLGALKSVRRENEYFL